MATDGDRARHSPEADMLPDEREVIADRIESLADESEQLSIEVVAEDLGIELE
ncbi:hypothetical protein [Halorussus amylolyticus]|uniref:hypothetical protein n=1 Tax=Halorussus amylolyticus TaxID=1126242 RepID=UPI00138ED1E6|nr:hypothetical protein [Halorussus amylolyticus]